MVDSVHFALIAEFEDVTLTNDGDMIELSVHAGHCSMFFPVVVGISQAAGQFIGKADLAVVSCMTSEDIGECIATNDWVLLDIDDSEDESGAVDTCANACDSGCILNTSVSAFTFFGKYWDSGKVDPAVELSLSFFWLCVVRTCTSSVVHIVEFGWAQQGTDTEYNILVDSELETAGFDAIQVKVELVEVCSCTSDTHVELESEILPVDCIWEYSWTDLLSRSSLLLLFLDGEGASTVDVLINRSLDVEAIEYAGFANVDASVRLWVDSVWESELIA